LANPSEPAHPVTLYHFEGWPDGNPPSGDSLDELKNIIEKAGEHVKQHRGETKFLVHCHAGLGRTGTTLALIQLYITVME
jgi:protein tyrosine phosphatase